MSIEPRPPDPVPERAVTEHDRHVAIDKIQRALADDDVSFDDVDQYFEQVYAARTHGELTQATASLPVYDAPPQPAPVHPIPRTGYSMFGDIKVGGWISAEGDINYGSGFGNVVVDLSSADLHHDITVRVRAIFGDVTVIVPDGVRSNLQSATVFGDSKTFLTPPFAGAPYVRVVAATLFGNAKLYSLSQVPKGRFQKLWRSLRGR